MIKVDGKHYLTALAAVFSLATVALAQYDPPANYYDPAIGLTGAPLKAALNDIIDQHAAIPYSSRETRIEILDQDPNNSANVIEIYSGVSVAKSQFPAGVANTEHCWPNSYGIDDDNPAYGDFFNLRPCDVDVNSDRGNKYYDDGGTLPAHPEAPLCRDDADSWEARPVEKGDLARSMFYLDTRYENDEDDGFPRNLTLTDNVAIINSTNDNMGKLSTLINWHYSDPVDTPERLRNHIIFQTSYLGVTFQQNRNPFIDHPEYVWAIWGPTPNDSRLYLGAIEPGNGASSIAVDLGEVITGAALPGPHDITLNKTGANQTTYDVLLGGQASSTSAGPRQSFIGGAQNRTISVGLATSTATAGLKSGTLTVDNTDLTSAGTGRGSADGNDLADISLRVLDHSDASFENTHNDDALLIDFGSVAAGTGIHTLNFTIYNREATAGFTAALDLDSVAESGDTSVLTTNATVFSDLEAGSGQLFSASLDSAVPGSYSAIYTLSFSDENLPGEGVGADLVLTLVGEVTASCAAADANCDSVVTMADVSPFVDVLLGLSSPCSPCAVDTNADSNFDGRDVQLFVDAVTAS